MSGIKEITLYNSTTATAVIKQLGVRDLRITAQPQSSLPSFF